MANGFTNGGGQGPGAVPTEHYRNLDDALPGIIPPGNPTQAATPIDCLRAHSSVMFAKFSAELRDQTGLDNGYIRCGGIDFTDGSEHDSAKEWQPQGVTVGKLSEEALQALEPRLAHGRCDLEGSERQCAMDSWGERAGVAHASALVCSRSLCGIDEALSL